MPRLARLAAAWAVALAAPLARAQSLPTTQATTPVEASVGHAPTHAPEVPRRATVRIGNDGEVTFGGYLEAFYQWNFNQPHNDVTALRAFDDRHNAFTVGNAVVDAQWTLRRAYGRIALQVGHTASGMYAQEPSRSSDTFGTTDGSLWRFIQQAYAGWNAPVGRGLKVEAGIFLSPLGPEAMALRDQWNWSHSYGFEGLPYYHAGLRATLAVSDRWAFTAGVFNGWNNVVDNNDAKTLLAQWTYTDARWAVSLLYLGGIERGPGAPEGPAWRHTFDAYATWSVTNRLSLQAHVDGGFEQNRMGASTWFTAALYARVRATRWLYLAWRGDVFREWAPTDSATGQTASRIFWPTDLVSSQTFTLEARPLDVVSVRLEYRHDLADGPAYYGEFADPMGRPTRGAQDTLTAGMITWF